MEMFCRWDNKRLGRGWMGGGGWRCKQGNIFINKLQFGNVSASGMGRWSITRVELRCLPVKLMDFLSMLTDAMLLWFPLHCGWMLWGNQSITSSLYSHLYLIFINDLLTSIGKHPVQPSITQTLNQLINNITTNQCQIMNSLPCGLTHLHSHPHPIPAATRN